MGHTITIREYEYLSLGKVTSNDEKTLSLHRANNALLDKNTIKLAEIPVFERCLKYGTSPDYIPKKVKETPEMIVSVKLYA